jgi:hypothetical protein
MKKSILVKFTLAGALLVILSASALAVSGPYTVWARVVSGSGAIQAVLQPGEFNVPAGSTAVIKKFQHNDPKSGFQNLTLGRHIYSVSQGKYMVDAAGSALMQLPAGRYRFTVGGGVGASGMLVYELHP